MVIQPGVERFHKEHDTCSFCGEAFNQGAVWAGPNISLCRSCLISDHTADIMGRIFADALFAVYGEQAYTAEVGRIIRQVEASIYRILYNHARSAFKRAGAAA